MRLLGPIVCEPNLTDTTLGQVQEVSLITVHKVASQAYYWDPYLIWSNLRAFLV